MMQNSHLTPSCPCSHWLPFPPTEMCWAVKSSFCRYVRAAGGDISVLAPWMLQDEGFVAPASTSTSEQGQRVEVPGGVIFTAHGGRMRVAVQSLSLTITADNASLMIDDPDDADNALVIARCELQHIGEELHVTPKLTFFGCRLFGDAYQPGDALDPMVLRGARA